MKLLKISRFLVGLFFFVASLIAQDAILEFKGSYFLSTHSVFKDIYGKGGALYGPELTVQLCNDKNWYAFASFDYLQKKGYSLGFCDKTRVRLIPLTFGLKYFVPVAEENVDFYAGLGFVSENVRTKNCSEFVTAKTSQWGFGGIAKFGAYYRLPQNFVLDFFIDYNFVKVGSSDCDCQGSPIVESVKANVGGAIFGTGIGYRF
jgi:hypothetical protein